MNHDHFEPLSLEQEQIKSVFLRGDSAFITGAGGTGKTHLIRELIKSTGMREPESVITAMTGCASILIHDNAKTLASWSGIGIANSEDDKIIERVRKNKAVRKNWSKVQVLFVDEVSMLSRRVFELLDKIARKIRKCDMPFGGIQGCDHSSKFFFKFLLFSCQDLIVHADGDHVICIPLLCVLN